MVSVNSVMINVWLARRLIEMYVRNVEERFSRFLVIRLVLMRVLLGFMGRRI